MQTDKHSCIFAKNKTNFMQKNKHANMQPTRRHRGATRHILSLFFCDELESSVSHGAP